MLGLMRKDEAVTLTEIVRRTQAVASAQPSQRLPTPALHGLEVPAGATTSPGVRRVGGDSALDAFSGSGVVSYLLKTLGYQVTANDFLSFPAAIAGPPWSTRTQQLTAEDIERHLRATGR